MNKVRFGVGVVMALMGVGFGYLAGKDGKKQDENLADKIQDAADVVKQGTAAAKCAAEDAVEAAKNAAEEAKEKVSGSKEDKKEEK